jgi:hypothetical protein
LGKELLDMLPLIIAFIAGGAWSLLLVKGAKKQAKKHWDADFLSRYKEEHRSEIQERDTYIASIEAQLKEEREARGELERRARVAVAKAGRITEVLGTAEPTPASRVGFGSPIRRRIQ